MCLCGVSLILPERDPIRTTRSGLVPRGAVVSPAKRGKAGFVQSVWVAPPWGGVYLRGYFLSRSRISVRSFSSALGSGAGAGAASSSAFFLRVSAAMPFTMRKMQNAMMRKSTTS